MASLQRYAGGAAGIGGAIAMRQFLDEPGQSRFTQPSVLYGLGTGLAAGGLYLTDAVDLPVLGDGFLAAHAIGATPAGLFYSAFPKQRTTSTTQQVREALLSGSQSPRRTPGSPDTADSGSTQVEAVGGGRRSAGSR
jgi:hypothetical protein